MSSKTNHWKLGAFVVTGFTVGLAAIFFLGAGELARETVSNVTYFDESVQGLDVGSPVKFRGVTVGSVTHITVAPDKRNVEVHAKSYRDVLERLGLRDPGSDTTESSENLRVQLAMTGITGAKFLLVDFFDPPPELPTYDFRVPDDYIPSVPSTLKSIEEDFMRAVADLPDTIDQFRRAAVKVEKVLDDLDAANLSSDVKSVLGKVDRGLDQLRVSETMEELRELISALEQLASSMGSEGGAVDSVVKDWNELTTEIESTIADAQLRETTENLRSTSDAFRGLAIETTGMTTEFHRNLRVMAETLDALRSFVSYLERDPGALLRGRPDGEN